METALGTILLVDDELDLAELLKWYLEGQGYRVLLAGDGVEGLHSAVNERPDVIVTDMMMPRMDGDELVEKLRGTPRTREVPVIGMSSLGERGSLPCLRKPFHPRRLVEAIRAALGQAPEPAP